MALKVHKWLPETNVRAHNYGNSPLEFSFYLTTDKNCKGKTFTLQPKSFQLIMVKDLLPVSKEQLRNMTENDISISLKNIGTETTQFNVLEHGPYWYKTDELDYGDNTLQKTIDYYGEAIAEHDYYTMEQIVNAPVPERWKNNAAFYSIVCHNRAKMFRCFLRLAESEAALEAGWEGYMKELKWQYIFEWVDTLKTYLIKPEATVSEKGRALQKAIEILNRLPLHVQGLTYEKHYLMAASCLRAFMLCYLGEEEQAFEEFDDFDFTPLTPDEYSKPELDYFFRFVANGFWVALELKNAALLRNLSSIISTGFPDMLDEPSPVHCFRRAFGNAHEKGRVDLNTETYNLTLLAHNLAPEFVNLRQFVVYLNNKDDYNIEHYIGFVE